MVKSQVRGTFYGPMFVGRSLCADLPNITTYTHKGVTGKYKHDLIVIVIHWIDIFSFLTQFKIYMFTMFLAFTYFHTQSVLKEQKAYSKRTLQSYFL